MSGVWTSSRGGLTFSFTPNTPLRMGARVSVSLNGVTDLAGTLLQSTTVPVTTFTPTRLSSTCLEQLGTVCQAGAGGLSAPLPVKDVAFLRQHGDDNAIHTRVVAITSNQAGFKLHSIDVTNPTQPQELGHAAGGSFKRAAGSGPQPDEARQVLDYVQDVQLVPQLTHRWDVGRRVPRDDHRVAEPASLSIRKRSRRAAAFGRSTD